MGIRILSVILVLTFLGCHTHESNQNPDPGLLHPKRNIPDREGWNATIRVSMAGRLQAVIEYGHVMYYETSRINHFDQGVRVDMFDKKGRHTTRLTAERGEFNELTQDIRVLENVVVVSDTGITLCTSILNWNQQMEKIMSDTAVMVTTVEKDTIYGTAFQSNADLTHMIIKNPKGSREDSVDFGVLEKEITGQESDSLKGVSK
jgi:LPS export ABC transporter protein LptC